jgi:aldehyde dehydrogenase (NAD(P)+)
VAARHGRLAGVLGGTLAAAVLASGATLGDPTTAAAVEVAIRGLRYGSVSLNLFPGLAYSSGTGPWGAFPGSTLADIQSGRGLVHNTRMLERVEKLVVRGPAAGLVKMPWFPSHRTTQLLGPRLFELEGAGRWSRLPAVLSAALRG